MLGGLGRLNSRGGGTFGQAKQKERSSIAQSAPTYGHTACRPLKPRIRARPSNADQVPDMFLPPSPQEPFPYLAEMESLENTEYGASRSLSTSFIRNNILNNRHTQQNQNQQFGNSNLARFQHSLPPPSLGRLRGNAQQVEAQQQQSTSQSIELSSSPTIMSVLQSPSTSLPNNSHSSQNTQFSQLGSIPRYNASAPSSRNPANSAFRSALQGGQIDHNPANNNQDEFPLDDVDDNGLQFDISLDAADDLSRDMDSLSMMY